MSYVPSHNESAGKHRPGRTRKGKRWLRAALVEAALAAIWRKDSALAARYRRLVRHRGHKKAIVAVAHAILWAAYQILAHQRTYQNLGADYFDQHHRERVTRRAVHLLEHLGYQVTLEQAA